MSVNDHHMERQYSSQSFSSRDGSETGSQYESRLSMSSFTATVFIVGLITVGILMITLVIALTAMLQSCQSQNSGILENQKSYDDDYHYCKIVASHMELNQFETVEIPSICKDYAVSYISQGQYFKELNFSISLAEKYFSSLSTPDHGFTVVLMDIDDILPSSFLWSKSSKNSCRDLIDEAIKSQRMLMLRLYNRLKECQLPVILITKRAQEKRSVITKYLFSAGYMGWESLMMRSTNEVMLTNLEYFSRRITALRRQGYHIAGVVSSRMDPLAGFHEGKRVFKLPNMQFQNIECSNFS